jgi:hypothetical protein
MISNHNFIRIWKEKGGPSKLGGSNVFIWKGNSTDKKSVSSDCSLIYIYIYIYI